MAERVELHWKGRGMVFDGRRDERHAITIDGDGAEAVSPLTAFLLGIGACTASDVVDIAGKMRVPVERFDLVIEGARVSDMPRRYRALRLVYRLGGVAEPDHEKIRRAVSLSHEKYCSALSTLRTDIDVSTDIVFED
jgi:putative redox protein